MSLYSVWLLVLNEFVTGVATSVPALCGPPDSSSLLFCIFMLFLFLPLLLGSLEAAMAT